MKKFFKLILIIALLLGVVYVGYIVIDKYVLSKYNEIKKEEGFEAYLNALEETKNKGEYYIQYSNKLSGEEKRNETGKTTFNNNSYYSEWEGADPGKLYISQIDSTRYGKFEVNPYEEKKSSWISNTEFKSAYGTIQNKYYLEFTRFLTIEENEIYLKGFFYDDLVTSEEKVEHFFGENDDGYVWRTTVKCVYEEEGTRYSSVLKREIYFDSIISKVTFTKTDKEINEKDKVVKKGKKKTLEISNKIECYLNQSLVKFDYSEFPHLG